MFGQKVQTSVTISETSAGIYTIVGQKVQTGVHISTLFGQKVQT